MPNQAPTGKIAPKAENAYGDTFDRWLQKLSAALTGAEVSWGERVWQVAAFNCNYFPEVAAYELRCKADPLYRLTHYAGGPT